MDKEYDTIILIKEYCFDNDIDYNDFYYYTVFSNIVKLEKKDYNFDSSYLAIVCHFFALNSIKYLLNHKIKPDERCFNELINFYKNKFDDEKVTDEFIEIEEIESMMYLINYGYKLTLKNYRDLAKIFICIDDLEKYFNEEQINKKEI